jgi:hypothetical protein
LLRIIIAAANKKWDMCSYAVGFACRNHRGFFAQIAVGLVSPKCIAHRRLDADEHRSATRVQVLPPAKRAAMRLEA